MYYLEGQSEKPVENLLHIKEHDLEWHLCLLSKDNDFLYFKFGLAWIEDVAQVATSITVQDSLS